MAAQDVSYRWTWFDQGGAIWLTEGRMEGGHVAVACYENQDGTSSVRQINVAFEMGDGEFDPFAESLPGRLRIVPDGAIHELSFVTINVVRARSDFDSFAGSLTEYNALYRRIGEEIGDGGVEMAVEVGGHLFRAPILDLTEVLAGGGCSFG